MTQTFDRELLIYSDGAGKSVAGWRHTYDAAGNRLETVDVRGLASRYKYDPAGQLLEEDAGPGKVVRYMYLPGGNRHKREHEGQAVLYRYDQADRLLEAGGETFAYDANGNLVERRGASGTTRYAYDTEDRLVKVEMPDGSEVSFGYAPTGERVWRRDATGLTYFLTDGVNLLAELDEHLKPRATYLHGPGIDHPLIMVRNGQSYFYHADVLGSITHVTDAQGQVVAAYEYDTFGMLRAQQGSVPNPFTFTAREFEPRAQLYYYRARYYDAALGRFLSQDPSPARLEEPLELDRFLYVRNNPVRFVDPLGTAQMMPEPS